MAFFKGIFSIGKKAILVTMVFGIILTSFFYLMNKDKINFKIDPTTEGRKNIYELINNKQLNSTPGGKNFIAIYRLVNCRFVGEGCTKNQNDGEKYFKSSILGFVSKLISFQYVNPPASGFYWAANGLANAGFIPKTYAAEGVGFAALKPFIKVWSTFRNFTFVIFVLVIVVIGFMIMFRMKLNAQTVISVENALPRIVVAMILITFSYAIAGFLIDLMYILMLLVISLISSVGVADYIPSNNFNLLNSYIGAGPAKLFPMQYDWINTGNYLLSIIPLSLGGVLKVVAGFLASFGISQLIVNLTGSKDMVYSLKDVAIQAATFGFSVGDLPNIVGVIINLFVAGIFSIFILPLIISILVALTILFVFFRLFFILLSTYIQILLLIFFSPIILLFEAFPGRGAFSWWIKNLLANLMTFPFVLLIILISDVVIKINAQVGADQFWSPPFLYPLDQTSIAFLFGLGLYIILPDLIKTMKEMMGVKPLPVNIGLSTFFGGAGALLGAQGGLGALTSLTQMPLIGPMILGKVRSMKGGSELLSKILGPTEGQLMAREIREMKKSGEWDK